MMARIGASVEHDRPRKRSNSGFPQLSNRPAPSDCAPAAQAASPTERSQFDLRRRTDRVLATRVRGIQRSLRPPEAGRNPHDGQGRHRGDPAVPIGRTSPAIEPICPLRDATCAALVTRSGRREMKRVRLSWSDEWLASVASSAADRNTPTAHNRPQRDETRQPFSHYACSAWHRPGGSMSRSVANPNRHRSLSLGTEQNRRSTTQTLPTESLTSTSKAAFSKSITSTARVPAEPSAGVT